MLLSCDSCTSHTCMEHCCPCPARDAAGGTHSSHQVGERDWVVHAGMFLLKACCQRHVSHLGTEKSIEHHTALPRRRTLSMVHVHPISLYVLESPFPLWVIQGPQTSSLPWLTVRTEVPATGKVCARAAEAVPPKWVSAP